MPDVAPVTNAFIPFNDFMFVSHCLGYFSADCTGDAGATLAATHVEVIDEGAQHCGM
jgi:hypothetical protein